MHLARGKFVVATIIDHIIPLSKGGADTDANTQALCPACHSKKSSQDGFITKQKNKIGVDGWPIDE